MSIQAMNANQHVSKLLRAIADNLETNAATLPEPQHALVIVHVAHSDEVTAWARTHLGKGTSTNKAGQVFAEVWFDSIVGLRIQADGRGTL